MVWGGTRYIYLKNAQGDITGIRSETDGSVFYYLYDAWGHVEGIRYNDNTDASGLLAAKFNPLRYRGYVYDPETGFYYLNSRYYFAYMARFLNGDDTVSTGQGLNGNNMFAYCGNNSPVFVDPNGTACAYIGIGSFSDKAYANYKLNEILKKLKSDSSSDNSPYEGRATDVTKYPEHVGGNSMFSYESGKKSTFSVSSAGEGIHLILDYTVENGNASSKYAIVASYGGVSATLNPNGYSFSYSSGNFFAFYSRSIGVNDSITYYWGTNSNGMKMGQYFTTNMNTTAELGIAAAVVAGAVLGPIALAAVASTLSPVAMANVLP